MPVATKNHVACAEQVRLRGELAHAIKSLVKAHSSHHEAVMTGDPRVFGYEVALDSADAEWQSARSCYLEHRRTHGC